MKRGIWIVALAIAMLIATQPLGILSHVTHDHFGEDAHAAHSGIDVHLGDSDVIDYDADHHHVLITAAAPLEAPQLSRPRDVAAVAVPPAVSWLSATPFPPFSPPRA
jgi:hypothetical protein